MIQIAKRFCGKEYPETMVMSIRELGRIGGG